MPHVNGVPDKTKWLLQSKYNLDTLYITQNVIGWEFSIDRNVILLMPIFRLYAYIKSYALEGLSHVLLNSCTQHYVFLIYKVGRCWVHVCNGMECAMYNIVKSP